MTDISLSFGGEVEDRRRFFVKRIGGVISADLGDSSHDTRERFV